MNTATDHRDHPIKITVRTLAGHEDKATVKPSTLVATFTDKEVKHFVNHGQLTAGDYALTLPRRSGEAELDPTATLSSAGVIDADILVLVSRKPQADG